MNPFKRTGFDTLIAAGTKLNGSISLPANSVTVLDGEVDGPSIKMALTETEKVTKTTLIVNGKAGVVHDINVQNVTVTGEIICDLLTVEGTLAVKAGAKIKAREVRYRDIVIETGAVVLAQMNHLDHISAGEQV